MPLSSFSQDVLRILDEASRPLSPEEIAIKLTRETEKRISANQIRSYLEHSLGKYAEQVPKDKWKIVPSFRGEFSSTRTGTTGTEPEENSTRASEANAESDEITEAVLDVLERSDSPLPAEEIARRIQDEADSSLRFSTIKTKVNRKLQLELTSRVERNDNFSWGLVSETRSEGDNASSRGVGVEDDDLSQLQSRFSKNRNDVYRGPEDLDRSEFLSALRRTNSEVRTAIERSTSRDIIEAALNEINPELAKEHTTLVKRGRPGLKPEEVIERAREGEIERSSPYRESSEGEEKEGENKIDRKSKDGSSDEQERLSFFQKDILGVIDQGVGNLSVEEIMAALDEERGRSATHSEILSQLRGDLSEFITRKSRGWDIAPAYSGRYSVGVNSSQENGDTSRKGDRDRSRSNEKSDEERKSSEDGNAAEEEGDFDQLSSQIFQILHESDGPMKAREIAEEMQDGSRSAPYNRVNDIKTAVNQRLYGELSSFVEQDEHYRWEIDLYDKAVRRAVEGRIGETSGPSVGELVDKVLDENLGKESRPTPAGSYEKISERLELAKHVAFLLDLFPEPLTVERVASILDARGQEVSPESVENCLESTLAPHVQSEEGRYHLVEEERVLSKGASSGESHEEKEEKPSDVSIQASVAGSRYEYTFRGEKLETSSLFMSQVKGGTVEIKLNASHPGFKSLWRALNEKAEGARGVEENHLREMIRLLIVSWTEVEGDLSGRRGEIAEELKNDWGRVLRSLLREKQG